MITSVGKRVELVKHLKNIFFVIGADISELAPATHFSNKFIKVPKFISPNYSAEILNCVKNEKIKLLIPLHEAEFNILDSIRDELTKLGCTLLLSPKSTLSIFQDKWEAYTFFKNNNLQTPKSFIDIDINREFPMFIKPRNGAGSKNALKLSSMNDLNFYLSKIEEPIIQEFIDGTEYTVDCLADFKGNLLSAVVRERMEVIGGEVSKTRTLLDLEIIETTKKVFNTIKFVGPITIQFIRNKEGKLFLIEINPRFGGGVPAAFAAGINYAEILYQLLSDKPSSATDLIPYNEITVLRFSEAIVI
jgi:carbamoyl-phosphate synthase large subunit